MPEWAAAIEAHAGKRTAQRLVVQLAAVEVAALAFCRLLETWARGEAKPGTAEARVTALRQAADRVEAALAGLERPLGRYLLELEEASALAEGRSWFGDPGHGELVDWAPVLQRAGIQADPHLVAAAYLELAVLVRALEGLASASRFEAAVDRGSLWAGLFDLRENLLGPALDDLRALNG